MQKNIAFRLRWFKTGNFSFFYKFSHKKYRVFIMGINHLRFFIAVALVFGLYVWASSHTQSRGTASESTTVLE